MSKDIEKFYTSQAVVMAGTYTDPDYKATSETWLHEDDNTINNTRLQKLNRCFDPILNHYQGSEWLTVGDGRFGSDAHFLEKKGVNATATDIQDDLLKIGYERNFISKYAKQNAENLTYDNDSFDFVLCKESYHHFPRPAIAVYEMLRVAKVGIILHEPKDVRMFESPMQAFSDYCKRKYRSLRGKKQTGDDYEISGNYIYTISKREIEKMALGLNYRCVAFHLAQDHYIEGMEFEKSNTNSTLEKRFNRIIKTKEWLYKLGLYNGGLLTAIIFKNKPTQALINDLEKQGYTVSLLSENPYINSI